MIKLVKLSKDTNCYDLLQHIGPNENLFINDVYGKSLDYYNDWVKKMTDWDLGINLPDGYVKQTIYILYVENVPVGIGKIRHNLTDRMRKYGGNIGYAIDQRWRGKGFGEALLAELVRQAMILGIDEIIATVENDNIPSKRAVERLGGRVVYEDSERRSYVLYKREC